MTSAQAHPKCRPRGCVKNRKFEFLGILLVRSRSPLCRTPSHSASLSLSPSHTRHRSISPAARNYATIERICFLLLCSFPARAGEYKTLQCVQSSRLAVCPCINISSASTCCHFLLLCCTIQFLEHIHILSLSSSVPSKPGTL